MTDWTPVDLLPGLWLGLLGTFLVAALRRWYDPVPGRVLAVFAAVLLALFAPVLFGGRVLLGTDSLRVVAPSQAAVREALDQRRWPLWNRRAGAGMPLLADPGSQALQPLTLLGLPLPLPRALGFVAALRMLVALTFSFLWLRRLGLRSGPALAGALVYGGLLIFWVGWPAGNVAAFLPVALYAGVRCTDGKDSKDGKDLKDDGRDGFLLALAVLGLLLGGDPVATFCALAILLLFLLDRARRRPPGTRLALLARTGAALLVAVAVSPPVILPTLQYMPRAAAPWSLAPWQWRLPSSTPLRLAFPKTASLRAVQYGLAIHEPRGFRMAALGDVLPPNLAGLYDMTDARLHDPMAPRAYVEFTKPIAAGSPDDPLYQRLGVRYLLTPLDAQLPAPWARIFTDRTAAVWEQPDALPLFFLATPNPAGGVLTQTIEDTWISGAAQLRRRQWLGTSVYQDGGWLLLLNRSRHHTVLDSETFVAARLPRGANRLDLLYRPAAFVWGCVIAALGMVAGVAAFVPRPIPLPRPSSPRPSSPAPSPPPSPGEEGERQDRSNRVPPLPVRGVGRGRERGSGGEGPTTPAAPPPSAAPG
ncbi:MAG TPA: hypothetical protein VIA62_19005 [Thermoanaerobaculia bacterium]|nr:hypothetical protein [Thermoanaerobaculia bacterium]